MQECNRSAIHKLPYYSGPGRNKKDRLEIEWGRLRRDTSLNKKTSNTIE